MNGAPDRRKLVPPHLADPILLAHMDGELSRTESENARAHLEGCWSCRHRMNALEASIQNYMDQRAPLQPHQGLNGEQRVSQFRERLARHAAASELSAGETARGLFRSVATRILDHRRAALAAVVAGCLLVAMFTDVFGTRVSADTLLTRAQGVEVRQLARPGQVRRVTLRLDRVHHKSGVVQRLGTVTSIEDPEKSELYVWSESASGEREPAALVSTDSSPALALLRSDLPIPVADYLRSQHWLPAVTVEAFRLLTAGRGVTTSSVQKEAGVFLLNFPFANEHPSGIAEAQLRVDRSTFAPTGLSLLVGPPDDQVEYRFTPAETLIEVRTPEIARLFSPHDTVKTNRTPANRALAKVTPLPYAATQATDEEVHLNAALHQSDACMGEEIHVFPMSDGSLLVQGLVDKADRRDAVRKALQTADPGVPNQIFLPQELKSSSQLFDLPYHAPELSTPRAQPGNAVPDSSSQRIPLYEQLFQHFSRPGAAAESTEEQINAFSSEAVTLSRLTFLHAWALKRLDLEFSPGRMSRLSAASVQEIERMRQDHRQKIAAISRQQSEMLAQVGAGSASQLASASTKPLDTDTLLRLAQEENDLVRSLFTVSNSSPDTDSSVSRLLVVLRRIGS
jgi:anti-sigma factor RsiW